MKKLLGLLSMMAILTITANAQKVSVQKMPAPVKATFAKLHPNTKVTWEMEGKNFEAGFTANGKETSEVYTAAGVLMETEVEIKVSELPAAVMAKLKGMKITEAAKITKANGAVTYEAEVKGKDLVFDANGNPVKP